MSQKQTLKVPAQQAAQKKNPAPCAEFKPSQEAKILTYAEMQKMLPAGLKYAFTASLV
jgi:hypothetical protein